MHSPNYYAILPANVRYDKRLTPNAKLLYSEITALSNEKGYCWASNKYFADLYQVSTTSISKWISNLIEFGYLKSTIKYKEGTKEILHRYISLVKDPIEEKLNTPIEEKLKDNTTLLNNTINNKIEFIVFWDLYGKKLGSKSKTEKKWNKLSLTVQQKIIDTLPDFKKSVNDIKFLPFPETYLNNERWNDELSIVKPTEQRSTTKVTIFG